MKIYTSVSLELISPESRRIADEYIATWHKYNLASADLPSMLGDLTGYELVSTDLHCNGWHNAHTRQIALSKTNTTPYYTLFHEIGHSIQSKVGHLHKGTGIISEDLKIEWEAESLSWYMYNKCFSQAKQPSYEFRSYFTEESWRFLINWYGKWRQNDIEQYLTPLINEGIQT